MAISKSLILMSLLAAISASSSFNQVRGFNQAEKRGPHGLINENLPVIDGESGDSDWPPIQEPWRCLESQSSDDIERFNVAIRAMSGIFKADPNCPLVTPEICVAAEFFPVPCNCHAYVRCFQMDTDGPLMPCIYKCTPYDLIFSPNEGVCVNESGYPSPYCIDTPPRPPH